MIPAIGIKVLPRQGILILKCLGIPKLDQWWKSLIDKEIADYKTSWDDTFIPLPVKVMDNPLKLLEKKCQIDEKGLLLQKLKAPNKGYDT